MNDIEVCSRRVPDKWLGHFDMLRDTPRNIFYIRALQEIQGRASLLSDNSSVDTDDDFWCEIGCGSGLLACLVAQILGKHVVAFECVPALAKVARETIALNSLMHLVTVYCCHTSNLDETFMEYAFGRRAVGVISELLDTGLLGEGLCAGMSHAHQCLLSHPSPIKHVMHHPNKIPRHNMPNIKLIPSHARVFVSAWTGDDLVGRASILKETLDALYGLQLPPSVLDCISNQGLPSTIQFAPLITKNCREISRPLEILSFDFSNMAYSQCRLGNVSDVNSSDEDERNYNISLPLLAPCGITNTSVDALVLWWICDLGPTVDESVSMRTHWDGKSPSSHQKRSSTAPSHAYSKVPVRDHWRQSVFFQHGKHNVGGHVNLSIGHNKDDIWIRAENPNSVCGTRPHQNTSKEVSSDDCSDGSAVHTSQPFCSCALHMCCDNFRFKWLNSPQGVAWMKHQCSVVTDVVGKNHLSGGASGCIENKDDFSRHIIICFGDNPLLPSSLVQSLQQQQVAPNRDSGHDEVLLVSLFDLPHLCALNDSTLQFNQAGLTAGWDTMNVVSIYMGADELENVELQDGSTVGNPSKKEVEWINKLESCVSKTEAPDDVLKFLLVGDPYFCQKSNESLLYQSIRLYQLQQVVYNWWDDRFALRTSQQLSHMEVLRQNVHIHVAFFSCAELWNFYCSPIGSVSAPTGVDASEGGSASHGIPGVPSAACIDMCAINQLMTSECDHDYATGEFICCRVSQWGDMDKMIVSATVSSVSTDSNSNTCDARDTSLLGTMTLNPVDAAAPSFNAVKSLSLDSSSGSILHGLVFWVTVEGLTGSSFIDTQDTPCRCQPCTNSSHPVTNAHSVQSIVCFDKPYALLPSTPSDTTITINCSYVLDKDKFIVSVNN